MSGPRFGPVARWAFAVVGVVLLAVGVFLAATEPVDSVQQVHLLLGLGCWGAAGVLFPFSDPQGHDRRWRVFAVLAAAPVATGWLLLGPVGLVAPGWVADPGAVGRWPRTPELAQSTGVLFLVLGALLVGMVLLARRADRRIQRRRDRRGPTG